MLAILALSGSVHAAPQDTHLLFDRQSDGNVDFLEIDSASALDLTGGSFTISAWINPSGWGENDQGRIVDHGGGSGPASGWSFQLENKASSGRPQALRLQVNNDGGFFAVSSSGAITLGAWQHVAVTLEEGLLTFYVDGQAAGSHQAAPTPAAMAVPVRIGGRATDLLRGFDGAIDEVRLWNRALSQQEIQASMNAELVGNEVGLIAYYRINEGSGQAVADSTGNGRTARLGSTTGSDVNDPAWQVTVVDNQAPSVDAGGDRTIVLPTNSITLAGNVTDDGFPGNPLVVGWSISSGPGAVTFSDSTAVDSQATFAVAGTYVLRLSANDGEFADADTMTVTVATEPVLTTIVVSPATASMAPGESRQFSAEGRDQSGNAMAIVPMWSATGGGIDSNGLYTAGPATGSFQVQATEDSVTGAADVSITAAATVWPTSGWTVATAEELNMDAALLAQARDYALSGGGSGMISRSGHQVMAWGDQLLRYDLKSTTKSIGVTVLGLALRDGLIALDDRGQLYLPGIGLPPEENAATGWLDDITLRHLATHTAGFDKPGGYEALLFAPGTAWSYTDGGANWLADVLTVRYGADLNALMFARVFTPLGLDSADLVWRNHLYREQTLSGVARREFGSGIRANVDALARIGYLYLRQGQWDGQTIIPSGFVDQASRSVPGVTGLPVLNEQAFGTASDHYGLLWWNNADGTLPSVPTDAYWSWGLLDSVILVIPSLDVVAARAGGGWRSGWDPDYSVIEPFILPIVQSVNDPEPVNEAPQVDAGADRQIELPTDTVSLDGTVTDDGLPDGTLTTAWSVVSGPGAVTFGNAATVDTTATFAQAGTYVLQLTANDGELSAGDTVTVLVASPTNDPPQVDAGSDQQIQLPTDTVSLDGTVSDDGLPEGTLTTAWSVVSGPGAVTFGNAAAVDTTASFGSAGTYVLQLQASDGELLASDTVSVTVLAELVNQGPQVEAGADQTIRLPVDTVSLDGTVTDDGLPGGSLVTQWSVVSGPGAVSFGAAGSVDTTASFTVAGSYVLQLSADDGALSAADTLTVTVEAAPVLSSIQVTPGSVPLAPGATQQFTAAGQDQYGAAIAISPGWTATGGTIDATGLYQAGSVAGSFSVTATEGAVSGQATVSITDSGADAGIRFTDASAALGITVIRKSYAIAWADYDDDGWVDVFLNNHFGSPTFLLRNTGGQFVDVAETAGVDIQRDHHSCRWGDYDDDGHLDLYCSTGAQFGTSSIDANLWRSNGDGTFEDLAVTAGVANGLGRSRSANWIDIDGDGDLDLFVGNDSQGPSEPTSILFRNDGGSFVDVTSRIDSQLRGGVPHSIVFDYRRDGDWDLLLKFESSGNADGYSGPCGWCILILDNDGNGSFTTILGRDVGLASGHVGPLSLADFDNDGDLDLFTGHNQASHLQFFVNLGNGTFQQVSLQSVGLSDLETSTTVKHITWADLDNNGFVDLYVVRQGGTTNPPNELFLNEGDGTFTNASSTANVRGPTTGVGDGSAVADYDNDGFLDVLLSNGDDGDDGPYQLLRNDGTAFNWLRVIPKSSRGSVKRDVKITVKTAQGQQYREFVDQSGKSGVDELVGHFGVGNSQVAEWVRLDWGDGRVSELSDVEVNREITAIEPDGSTVNAQPNVDAGVDLSIELPTDTVSLDGTVTDDGLPDGTLTTAWSVVSGPGAVLFGDAAAVDTTASFGQSGSYVLELTADDGDLTASDTVTVTVDPEPVNEAPVVDAGVDQQIQLPTDTVSLDGTVTDDGLPDGTLTTQWSVVSGPGAVTFGNAAAVDTTASFAQAGTYVLQLTANDGELSAGDTVTVLVASPANEPPQVAAGSDQQIQLPTDTVSLDGTVSDDGLPEGTLTTAWSVVSGPGAVTFGNAAAVDTTASFGSAGTYVLQLQASDGELVASDTVSVTVLAELVNAAPQVEAGADQTIRLPVDTVSLDGTVTDDGLPGGSLVTQWSVVSGPGAVSFGAAGSVDTTASFTEAGSYVLQLSADDGALSAADTLTVTVEAAPVLSSIQVTPASVSLAPGATQQFTAAGQDQYGAAIAISPGWTATGGTISSGGLYTAGSVTGNYTVTATEGTVSGQASVSIEVVTSAPKQRYLQFDGANDVVTVTDDASLDITNAVTVEAWVRPDTIANNRQQDRIVDKTAFELMISTGDTGCNFGSNGHVQWRATIGGSNQRLCGGVLTAGVWHHLAGTYDGSQFVLYVDGAPVASAPRSGLLSTNELLMYLGNRADGSRGLDGALDEVRIWNRALSAAEIVAGRDVEIDGDEPNLIAYYRFNEGSGQTAADSSSLTNGGVLGLDPAPDSADPIWVSETPTNAPPTVDAGTNQAIELPTDSVTLDGTVSDDGLPDGTLTTTWSVVSGPGAVLFGDDAAVDTTASFGQSGSYVLQLTADDGDLTASDTVTVTVDPEPVNEPPVVDAGVDQQVELPTDTVSLDGTVTDDGLPDGTLTTAWSVVSGPAAVLFGDASAVDTTATFVDPGSYVLQLTADDGDLTASDTVTVTVDPEPVNAAPVVDAGVDQQIELPVDTVNLDGTVTDDGLPDGTLTTSWSVVSGPGGVTFGNAAAVDTTASFAQAGTYVLQLTANDGELNAGDTLTVLVASPTNEPPQVAAGIDQQIQLPTDTVSLDGTVSDDGLPDGTLTTAWSVVSGPGAVTFGNAAAVDTTASFGAAGDYVLQLQASDGELVASDTVSVTVLAELVNQGPQVEAGGDQTIRLPVDTVSLDGTVSDDGLPGGSLVTQWSVVSGPGAVTFGAAGSVDTTASFPVAGDYLLQLSADDGALSAADTLTVTVEAAPVLTSIQVTPASVTLAPGATQQFTAAGQDQYGAAVALSPGWTATGGTIDATGLYQAGSVEGSFSVTATEGAVSGQATVSIEVVTSAPKQRYLQFDGANDVATVPDDASLDMTNAVTVEAWIRADRISNNRQQDWIVDKAVFELMISTGVTGCNFGSNGHVQWRATIGGSNQQLCGGVLTAGVWHHLAGTYDGSQFVLYVDGAPVASAPRSGLLSTNELLMYLGNRAAGNRGLDGALDEVRIWNRALSAAEIVAGRDVEIDGDEPNLIAYYRFNEGSGQIVTDQTTFSNDGVLGSTLNTESNDPQWGME